MQGRFHSQVRLEQARHADLTRTAQQRLVRADEEIDLGFPGHCDKSSANAASALG
jgi:hypothetical protein